MGLGVLLVKHRRDFTHIAFIYFYDVEVFSIQILDYDFRSVVLSNIDSYELLKAIEF